MNKYNKWTDEQIEFVLKLREEGLTYNTISRRLEQVFSVKKTGGNIRIKMRAVAEKKIKEEKEMKIPENYEPATKKQCRYYAQLKSDDNTTKKELNLTTELLYGNALKGRLSKSFLQKAIADLVAKAEIEEKSVIKAKGRGTGKTVRWSEDEQLILLHYMYEGEVQNVLKKDIVNELASKKFDNRSVRSIEQQWAKLKRGGQTSRYVAFKRQKLKNILVKKPANKTIEPKVVSENTVINKKRWTDAEDEILLQNMYDCETTFGMKKSVCEELVNTFDNRTKHSISARWSKLKTGGRHSKYDSFKRQMNKPKAETLPEKIEVFVEKHGNPTTRHLSNAEKKMFREVNEALEALPERKHKRSKVNWNSDEEFELLCNFYELSIDEARNQFGRSYASLALRLEMIVDSEQPEHIAMLKKAAKVISKRKKEEAKNANMSRWKRRRIARKAKKAAKLEKKLNKLRGV
jgi:hypothetical protein